MNSDLIIEGYGPVSFINGTPANYSSSLIPEFIARYAHGIWGSIFLQELKTSKYLIRHFIFSLQKGASVLSKENNEGLQSLMNLKGEVAYMINEAKGVTLKEREYILIDAKDEDTTTTIVRGNVCVLWNTYYSADSYSELLPFFPRLKQDLANSLLKPFDFLFPPRTARYTVHDSIKAIWSERYIPSLTIKYIELHIQITLFTLLAQTYSEAEVDNVTELERQNAQIAKEIILKNIKVHLTPDKIAAEMFCTSSWLKKAFSKVYGIGMFHFLRKTRMELAREMLLEGASLKAVALEVGMKPTNFPKEFKAFFGYTVTALKKGQV